MSLVGHWEEAKFPAGINLVQTMAPGWRQIVSEVALDLITIPAVSALAQAAEVKLPARFFASLKIQSEEERQYINEGPQYPTLHTK